MAERRSGPVVARSHGGRPGAVDEDSQDESPDQTRAVPDAQQSPAGRKTAAMDALERNHPGIGHVSRDHLGAVILQRRVLRRG
jgi:hypothetical protein